MSLLTDHDKVRHQPVHHLVVNNKEADLKFNSYLTKNDTGFSVFVVLKKMFFQISINIIFFVTDRTRTHFPQYRNSLIIL